MKTIALLASVLLAAFPNQILANPEPPQPNILVIMTDDMGFSDLGCYGSEIETPTLDRLAAKGLRFSQFYNTAKCHSSRVSLLSGRWCKQAGDVALTRAVTIPEVLAPAGYFTAMSGKWHLDKEPTDFGFQRYFGHLSGACDYFTGDKTFRLNGQPWTVPAKGFYTTVTKVDFALEFLKEARSETKPWFLYVAFNAPHAPLQPLKEDYDKYRTKYESGWDVMNRERHAKQQELGIFVPEVDPAPRESSIPAWKDLTPELRDWESRRMAALAALIDRLDQEIGRLVADIEAAGELDNTLILFVNDNGACPYDRTSTGMNREPYQAGVHWSDSTGWSWARNTPFRYYKQNQFEGGITSPAIAHWPAGLKAKPGSITHSPAHLVDILPTLAEIGGAEIPTTFPGREPTALAGTSLTPIFAGESPETRPPLHFMFATDRGFRDGDWKIVSFRRQPWELYNIAEDRTELHDLAAKHPERVEKMVQQWHQMTAEDLRGSKADNQPVLEEATGHIHREWSDYSGKKGAITTRKATKANKKLADPIRARRETSLKTEGKRLILTCTKGDPGIALDQLGSLPAGPYKLSFRVRSNAAGAGEVFFTTDPKMPLNKGTNVALNIPHDDQWHEISIALETTSALKALRIDPCSEAGSVQIENLALHAQEGTLLKTWP
ncbi:MAG: arylsulfatase [Haloferula sp.]